MAGRGVPDIWLRLMDELNIDGATSRLKNPCIDWLDVIGKGIEYRPERDHAGDPLRMSGPSSH
jgi:hypothetical protein